MSKITVYTDGGNNRTTGMGGAGAVIIDGNSVTKLGGATKPATNNQMELSAFIIASIHLIQSGTTKFKVVTDSKYLMDGASKWIVNWERNGSLFNNGIKNANLWRVIRHINNLTDIKWVHVKGHTGNPYNEMADEITHIVRKVYQKRGSVPVKSLYEDEGIIKYSVGFIHRDLTDYEAKSLIIPSDVAPLNLTRKTYQW